MKAIVFDNMLGYAEDRPLPELNKTGEALVRVRMAGICNTDLEIIKGYMGFKGIPGHEFVGTVEKADGQNRSWIGKRVVGEINCVCGECDYCIGGLPRHCPRRTTLGISGRDGAFAEYLLLPARNLHEVPGNVPDEEAVFTEPLAAAFEILEQVTVKPADRIVVLGDGKLGLLCSFVLALTGAEIALAGNHGRKLAIAREAGIAVYPADSLPMGKKYDIVVEATGTPAGLGSSLELVRPRGTIVLKSTVASTREINLNRIVIDEITLLGSRCGPFEPALRALSERTVNVKPLISGIFPAEKALEAFRAAGQKGSLKVLIDFR
ncbi:MAG TPA: alcohol dehydrogenase catalytic domain-containing protein [Syntrophorhabdaceae bacterium]|nr:alcohol dehydrogenase catalytic domain-containing protein [Syntrophorhabdaceae bacterium]HQM80173.1 alcohol dehydrogenase catalytic domain-containing protein [Syntrophorhabdaceae bacterium]